MSAESILTIIEITVGDTGLTLSGQLNGGGLTTLVGSTVTLSVLGVELLDDTDTPYRFTGRDLVTAAAATITDGPNRKVAYKLQAADVAKVGKGIIRWAVTLPAGAGVVHFPGPEDQQVVLQINR